MAGHRDGGNVTQNGVLWKFIQDGTRGLLEQAKVQPLTILDLEDLEQLAGFVEAGYDLPKILAGETQQAFRHRELAIWVRKGLRAPREFPRPSLVERVWNEAMERAPEMIDLTKGLPSGEGG